MKKSENARRSWRGISASRSTNFQTFLSDQFFFYRNPPPHLRGRVRASFCRERRLNTKDSKLLSKRLNEIDFSARKRRHETAAGRAHKRQSLRWSGR